MQEEKVKLIKKLGFDISEEGRNRERFVSMQSNRGIVLICGTINTILQQPGADYEFPQPAIEVPEP